MIGFENNAILRIEDDGQGNQGLLRVNPIDDPGGNVQFLEANIAFGQGYDSSPLSHIEIAGSVMA